MRVFWTFHLKFNIVSNGSRKAKNMHFNGAIVNVINLKHREMSVICF